ncbi:MAG TPA: CHASE2 domain-containing protein [Elusimicrobiota bacterium]|nr:CHASE2 domain-containing protein [Elusimicrobiota bacterium]
MSRRRWGDAAAGLLAVVVAALSYQFPAKLPFFAHLELKAYDARALLRQSVDPDPEITIVAIDQDSLRRYGAWPWPRTLLADLLDKISPAHPKVVALDVSLFTPEKSAGLEEIKALAASYQSLASKRRIIDRRHLFKVYFSSAESSLDGDARLLASLRAAGNVVLPLALVPGSGEGFKPAPLPLSVSSDCLSASGGGAFPDLAAAGDSSALYPLPGFAQAALGLGREGMEPGYDGIVRRDATVSRYWGADVPSYGLAVALAARGVSPGSVAVEDGREIRSGNFYAPLEPSGRMLITFNGPTGTFHYDSFKAVMNGAAPAASFQGKIVFVGLTAPEAASFDKTPVDARLPEVEADANVTENILDQKFLSRPPWAGALEWALLGAAALFVIFVLPFLNAIWGAVFSVCAVAALAGAGAYWFVNGFWIKIAYAAGAVILGYLIVSLRRLLLLGRPEQPSAEEINRRMGLALREHGLLDAAFERLRVCRLNREVKAGLRALAEDFEASREYLKAAAVFEHLKDRDSKSRAAAAVKIEELRAKAAAPPPAREEPGRIAEAPDSGETLASLSLGGCEVREDLGRWEHGTLHRGWDAAAGREVLIKTLDPAAGGEHRGKIKEALLRDAAAAAALELPGLVRVLRAGESDGVLFAVCEVPGGSSLSAWTGRERLLPVDKAAGYAAAAADALEGAHARGLCHLDLSPSALWAQDDGSLRVSGLGLAAFASPLLGWKGVPESAYYLSPEQAAGKKTDARSDVFSLAVVLFELLTGEKPFAAEDDIGTLLFQIANKPHPDPSSLNPLVPQELKVILDRALAKAPEARYARAALLAEDLRACLARMKGASAA